ncbi:MAG: serine protease SohB [Bradymonadia bacterium]|jgi:serine protease SohB
MALFLDVMAFVLKSGIVLSVIVAALFAASVLFRRDADAPREGRLRTKRLDILSASRARAVDAATMTDKQYKAEQKKKEEIGSANPRTFVLRFVGDMHADAVDGLRECISAIVTAKKDGDDAILVLESPGGTVTGYGLAASQLQRLQAADVPLCVCVDQVAASGGYMMAVVSSEIVAAPFAVLGSIGVLLPVPNVSKLLKRVGVDYDEMTAGEYKRTVSLAGEITDEGRQKTQEQLEDTHMLFREHIARFRPELDVDRVSTGEIWYGSRAKELGLVDRIATSDDVILQRAETRAVVEVTYEHPQPLGRKLLGVLGRMTRAVGI